MEPGNDGAHYVQSVYIYRKTKTTLEYYAKSFSTWKPSAFTLRNKVFYKKHGGTRERMYSISRLTKKDAFLELL